MPEYKPALFCTMPVDGFTAAARVKLTPASLSVSVLPVLENVALMLRLVAVPEKTPSSVLPENVPSGLMVKVGTVSYTHLDVYKRQLSGDASALFTASDQAAAAGTTCTLLIGGLNLNSAFNGTLADSASQRLALSKTGSATLTLGGNNTCSGPVNVQAGTLVVDGSFANVSLVDVAAGATLNLVAGSVRAAQVTIESGGILTGNGTVTGSVKMCIRDRPPP